MNSHDNQSVGNGMAYTYECSNSMIVDRDRMCKEALPPLRFFCIKLL